MAEIQFSSVLLLPGNLACERTPLKYRYIYINIYIYFFLQNLSGPESQILESDWLIARS